MILYDDARKIIRLAQLIDVDWYVAAYADIAASGVDPVEHYLDRGWREGRQPNFYFAPEFYGRIGDFPGNPFEHYLDIGEALGWRPSLHFDPVWYRERHVVPREQCALAHYLKHRHTETVSPNRDFDAAFYAQNNPDVAGAGRDLFAHYISTGRGEGRLPMAEIALIGASGLFDENYYLLNAPDVLENPIGALAHFCVQGHTEDRNPNPYFAVAWYRANYPQRLHVNALTDYVLVGERLGRWPGPYFDPGWYGGAYALDPGVEKLAHYLARRRLQTYSPRGDFDVAAYVAANSATLGRGRDPFMHALLSAARRLPAAV